MPSDRFMRAFRDWERGGHIKEIAARHGYTPHGLRSMISTYIKTGPTAPVHPLISRDNLDRLREIARERGTTANAIAAEIIAERLAKPDRVTISRDQRAA